MARGGQGAVSAAELAEREGIPPVFLALILSDLRQRGILRARRGREGGYELAIDPNTFTLIDAIETLGGPLLPFACVSGGATREGDRRGRCRECPGTDVCPAERVLSAVSAAAAEALASIVLADLSFAGNHGANRAVRKG
jgi:Rrf2 family protein